MGSVRKLFSGWGRYPVQECVGWRPEKLNGLLLPQPMIARGQGRSYGDAALNQDGNIVLTERIDRFLEFDSDTGVLRAEAGVTLAQLIDVCLPRGWFLPVTPGTRFVSLGGCVAADVHGKNHFGDGAFSAFVDSISLQLADASVVDCSRADNSELFWATVGGMGLTGVIRDVTLRLKPVESASVRTVHVRAADLEQAFAGLAPQNGEYDYTVAWIDCLARGRRLGRSVIMHGRHATREEAGAKGDALQRKYRKPRSLPMDFPSWALNPLSISAFNALYYRYQGRRRAPFLTGIDPYFYPLDGIHHWNRMYGKRGFLQYQCVLPEKDAFDGVRRILERLAASRRASFLAVLKRMGPESGGLLSFPMAGYSLALDLPLCGSKLFDLLDELDQQVITAGGRVYLAKDARLDAGSLGAMYPRLDQWRAIKQQVDPQARFTSSMARRLGLVPA